MTAPPGYLTTPEPTADEVQRALEAYTAYRLGLTSISTVRQHAPRALHEATTIYHAVTPPSPSHQKGTAR